MTDLELQLQERVRVLETELADSDHTMQRMSALLTGVAAAIKGPPPPLTLHDWSDLPERAAEVVARAAQWKRRTQRVVAAANARSVDHIRGVITGAVTRHKLQQQVVHWCEAHRSALAAGDALVTQRDELRAQLDACQRKVQRLRDRVVPPGWSGPAEDF